MSKKNHAVIVKEETITPARATELLVGVKNVRRARFDHVAMLARAMREGEWELNGCTIKIDKAGSVIDGEHRLRACVSAEKPFRTLVAYGVEASSTIDTGFRARTVGQLVHAEGIKRSSIVASIARLKLMLDDHGDFECIGQTKAKLGISVQRLKTLIDANAEELQEAARIAASPAAVTGLPSGALGLVAFMAAKNPAMPGFMAGLETGEGLRKGNPAFALRERALNVGRRARLPFRDNCALIFKAWNAYVRKEPMPLLKWIGINEKIQTPLA